MSVVLVTGASGHVGSRLIERLLPHHTVIGMSRKAIATGPVAVRGDCGSFEDLRQLDRHEIDAVVHLAGEVGGTSEEAGLSANVLGSRRLLRYLSDRGCRKFVLASSIAATGCLSPAFTPESVPIPADHPCLARDAYGLSKAMLEELAAYFGRVVPDGEYTCLRFGWVMYSTRKEAPWCSLAEVPVLPFLYAAQVAIEDLLGGVEAVLQAPVRPGSRVYNLVGPDVRSRDSVAAVLRASLGDRAKHLDLGRFDVIGTASEPVYAMDGILADYGFCPRRSVCQA